MLNAQERHVMEATLRRFAARIDEVLSAVEGPDGDLSCIAGLLAEARGMDLVADPAPGAAGHELGVWGRHCHQEGLTLSLLTLSLLGETCAGFASAVHAQGLACLALDDRGHLPAGTPLAAAFMPEYGLPLGPEGSGLHWIEPVETDDGLVLNGTSHFALAEGVPHRLICLARGPDGGWAWLLVDSRAAGVELAEVRHRTGLRAARQYHLRCDGVHISPGRILHRGQAAWRRLQQIVACDWLGQAAIALGMARRSLRDARAYTAQRYQGGRIIEGHAAVQLLLGTAEYDIGVLAAILGQHADKALATQDPVALLRWAIQAKLALAEHAHRAVTHCLQTLGGYGYMEDYGLEKRLRDVSTLKSLHGAPDQLRLLLDGLARGA